MRRIPGDNVFLEAIMRMFSKSIVLLLSICFLVPSFATVASAHHGPHPRIKKYRTVKKQRRARRVRRLARRPVVRRHSRVVVVERPRTVVVHKPAREVEVIETTTETSSAATDRQKLGIGLRGNAIALSGDKVHLSTLENPIMYGPGISFTGRVSPKWDLELAVDYLQGSKDDFRQRSVPLTLSGLMLLFPESRVTPYGVAGGGVTFTQLSYGDGQFVHDITEANGHLGGGVKVRLSEDVALSADVRANMVYSHLGSTTSIKDSCVNAGACNGMETVSPDDKLDVGMTMQAGAILYF